MTFVLDGALLERGARVHAVGAAAKGPREELHAHDGEDDGEDDHDGRHLICAEADAPLAMLQRGRLHRRRRASACGTRLRRT